MSSKRQKISQRCTPALNGSHGVSYVRFNAVRLVEHHVNRNETFLNVNRSGKCRRLLNENVAQRDVFDITGRTTAKDVVVRIILTMKRKTKKFRFIYDQLVN